MDSERIVKRWLRLAHDPRYPRWIPQGTPEIKPEGTDLVIYPWEQENPKGVHYGLVAYMGKQGKPFHNYTYQTRKNERDHAMQQMIDSRRKQLENKLNERAQKKEFKTDLFFGDIMYTSWGYDQTQIEYYEVVEVPAGQTIVVREVAHKVVDDGDGFSETVVPVPGKYIGPEMRVRVQPGDKAKIEGHHASKWDGKPKRQTGPFGGH